MNQTSQYYNDHAASFFETTVGVDMGPLHARFLQKMPAGGRILDAGCGSGRDARAFKEQGFKVTAFDASPELARLASEHSGLHVHVAHFLSLPDAAQLGLPAGTLFDGIWACASLLHVARHDQPEAWSRLWRMLKPGGVLYASYKHRNTGQPIERMDTLGRPFTDCDEALLTEWLKPLPHVSGIETWLTTDQRPGEAQTWLNALVCRA